MSDVRGSKRDKKRFETELDRLKDFAGILAAITCDYDGYTTVKGLETLVDDLTNLVYDTIIDGKSVYTSDEDEDFEKAVAAACDGCLLSSTCDGQK